VCLKSVSHSSFVLYCCRAFTCVFFRCCTICLVCVCVCVCWLMCDLCWTAEPIGMLGCGLRDPKEPSIRWSVDPHQGKEHFLEPYLEMVRLSLGGSGDVASGYQSTVATCCSLCCQAHASCYKLLPPECSFGSLREIILPPYALTVPRIDVQQEMLFRFPKKPGWLRLFCLVTWPGCSKLIWTRVYNTCWHNTKPLLGPYCFFRHMIDHRTHASEHMHTKTV